MRQSVIERLEKQYGELRARLDAAELAPEEFRAELARLRVTDEDGQVWALNEAGRWFRYVDGQWIEAAPQGEEERRPAQRGRGWAVAAGIVVVAAVTVAVWLLALRSPDQVLTPTRASPSSSAAASTSMPTHTLAPSGGDVALVIARADLLVANSRFEEAWPLYEQAAAQSTTDALPLLSWARALAYDWRLEDALEKAHAAVDMAPDSAPANAVLARVYLWLGDAELALASATKAVGLDPNSATARAVLTEAQAAAGQYLDAGANSEMALALGSENATAHHARSVILWLTGAPSLALAEVERAAELEPNLWLRHQKAGELHLRVSSFDKALAHFEQALALRPKPQSYQGAGAALYHQAQYAAALEMLQAASQSGWVSSELDGYMAATLAQLGRCGDAVPFLQRAAARDPEWQVVLEAMARCELVALTATPGASPVPATSEGPPLPEATPTAPVTMPTRATPTPAVTAVTTPGATPSPTRPPAAALAGWIAFPLLEPSSGRVDVWMARWDGSERRVVAEGVRQPALNPSGTLLAVNGTRAGFEHLCLVERDGSSLREITNHVEDGAPDWSTDGRSLVFGSTMHGDKQPRIYFVDDVPFAGGRVEGRVLAWDGGGEVRGTHPEWLPDRRVVFSACDPRDPGRCGLFLAGSDPAPQAVVRLTDHPSDTAPAARGNRIAFMSERTGAWDIYIVSAGGGAPTQLTDSDAIDGLPEWSPDGRWIAYLSTEQGNWAVWAIRPDGSGKRKLFDLGGTPGTNWTEEQISWGR